jgi:hypothetical protein
MRETNTLYVDKTAFIYRLVSKPKGAFFLARPRRFGKSLTLSTLEAVFTGRRELFKGLAIDKLDYDWKTYPIIHLDMSLCAGDTVGAVSELLLERLDECAKKANVTLTGKTPVSRFNSLITAIAERGTPVVILIDEYDKPILEELDNLREAKKIRKLLRRFYGVAKATQRLQRFLFITGVASLAKVSFFSDLNHVLNISRIPEFATMLGYTQEEFEKNFDDYITAAAAQNKLSRKKFLAEFKTWYNGYCFAEDFPTVYNPVSVAQFFESGMVFKPFWFTTGGSLFLFELAQKNSLNFSERLAQALPASALEQFTVDNIDLLALFFQSGYFTIKSTEIKMGRINYHIGFPNYEVELSFEQDLLGLYLGVDNVPKVDDCAQRMYKALASQNYSAVIEELNNQLSFIPGKLLKRAESYYHTVAAMALRYSGAAVNIEEWVSTGIIDNTVTIGDFVYIFEFKIDKTADVALAQIHKKKYYAKFLGTGKKVILFGITFNTAKKCVADYKTEEL